MQKKLNAKKSQSITSGGGAKVEKTLASLIKTVKQKEEAA